MEQQPAIAVGATYVCTCGTPIRQLMRVGDPSVWKVEDLSWSKGVFVVGRLHECTELLPPISGSGGRLEIANYGRKIESNGLGVAEGR